MSIVKFVALYLIFCPMTTANAQENSDTITISIPLSRLEKAAVSYSAAEYGLKELHFFNPDKKDTFIVRHLISKKPVHIQQLNLFFNPKSKAFVPYEKDWLLFPGDSICLKQDRRGNLHMLSYHGKSSYIDINELYDLHFNSLLNNNKIFTINESNINRLKILIDSINTCYSIIQEKIQTSFDSGIIKAKHLSALTDFNLLLKYYRTSKLVFTKSMSPGEIKKYFEKEYAFLMAHLGSLDGINSKYSHYAISFIAKYQAAVKNKFSSDFWDYFDVVDKSFFNTSIYQNYVYSIFYGNSTIKNTALLSEILKKIKAAGISDHRFDSLLAEKEAEENINNTKNIGYMISFSGDTTQYYTVINHLHDKYVFVDFWATWCSPCRMQIPYLRMIKKSIKNKDIAFISISIDKDEAQNYWIASSKDEELASEKYNFRLLKGNENELLKQMNIRSVPRYLLYNKSGRLINGNFTTPDHKEFKSRLLKAIAE